MRNKKKAIIMALILFCLPPILFAQNININSNITVKKAMETLKKDYGYSFVFESGDVDTKKIIVIDAKNLSIDNAVKQILHGQNVSYEIRNKNIIVKKTTAINHLEKKDPKTITGTVTDADGIPIIGASIVDTGTNTVGITDPDGNFTLTISPGNSIKITYIGFRPQEIIINEKSAYKIILEENSQLLDEVVVIGYGTTKRKDFTGSVASIKLENSPVAMANNLNALESLKGNVTGLDIGAVKSAGEEPSMLIRGQNSIKGDNAPLIVVDGVIYMGSINNINPNDIASFDVLKDATSAAAYGSRSANGVIMITTKKGKEGKPVINFNAKGSMQTWHLKPTLMDGAQWIDAVSAKHQYNDLSFMSPQELMNYENGKETDWLDVVSRTGWVQDYQVSVSGAGQKMNYYLSAAYTNNEGIMVGDKFNRSTVLAKINTDITSWLNIGADASYSRSDYSGIGADIFFAQIFSPYDMVYRNEQLKLKEKSPNGTNDNVNPLWGVEDNTRDNLDVRNDFRANVYTELKLPFVPGLSYRFNFSGTLDNRQEGNFTHENYYVQIGPYDDESRYAESTVKNYLAKANGNFLDEHATSWVIDNILNYKNTFGKHTFDLTAVATRDQKRHEKKNMIGTDFAANGNSTLGVNGLHYAKTQKISLDNVMQRNIGYLGRLSYSYNDTYYLTGSYRRDGASVWGANTKWGDFGAVGTSWRITNEEFMKNLKFLDDMKLKLSWGRNGNQGGTAYGTLSRVSNGQSGGIIYPFDNSGLTSYGINQITIGNASLGWETTEAWNMGFETVSFKNRLFVDLDVYFSKTFDQLFSRTIPVMTGFPSMWSSLGEVSNKGVELTVRSVNIQNKDLNWTTGLTFWLNRNKIVHLYNEDLDGDGKEDDDIGNRLFIGHSVHSIYGYKQDGIVQVDDKEYIAANSVKPGTPKYVDINNDGVINEKDRSIVGCGDPNFKLNLSNTVTYKNWDLYVMFTGTFGGNGYFQQTNNAAYMTCGGLNRFATNSIYIPYWTEENRSNKYPSPTFVGDDYFLGLQNRAYIRLQDVTLSYTFRAPWVKKAGINNLKVFFAGKNLATITGWKGGDPETGSTIDSNGLYPVSTSLSLGANISF